MKTIIERTPGFSGWQQERWWSHCGQPGAFMGRAGKQELEAAGAGAVARIREAAGFDADDTGWPTFLEALDADGSPTAYLFRCTECGDIGGYADGH